MIVMKFGGTSTHDAAAINNVVRIVTFHITQNPVVVVSAIAQATNCLEETARNAALGNEERALGIVEELFQRHSVIVDQLIKTDSLKADLNLVIEQYHAEVRQLVKGVALLKELTPRTMDAICSYGERISSRIVAAGLQENEVDAVWVDASEFMITSDNFGRAEPQVELVTENLEKVVHPLIMKRKVPVTQGFIGVTASGSYTTMGRESSDYSASLIGAAMNAKKIQIWTDVDGILTADPTVVKGTRKIKKMTFEEAFELSYSGAKVLHPNTMLPVLEKKIPVQILNSKRPGGSGTLVDGDLHSPQDTAVLKSIAFKKNISVCSTTPHKRINQYLFWQGVFNVLTRHGVATGMIATSEYNIAFVLDGAEVAVIQRQLEEFGTVQILAGMGSICLVGSGIRETPGLANRVFSTLSDIKIVMISFGASGASLSLVIDEQQIPDALNRLHAEFFDGVGTNEIFDVSEN